MPTAAAFSPLETRVIRLAASRRERSRRGRSDRIVARLAGRPVAMTLADPRLEALRAQAVRLRDGSPAVDAEFLAAGYTPAQADTIRDFMRAMARRASPAARRDRLTHAGGIGLALGSIAGFVGLAAVCLL